MIAGAALTLNLMGYMFGLTALLFTSDRKETIPGARLDITSNVNTLEDPGDCRLPSMR